MIKSMKWELWLGIFALILIGGLLLLEDLLAEIRFGNDVLGRLMSDAVPNAAPDIVEGVVTDKVVHDV